MRTVQSQWLTLLGAAALLILTVAAPPPAGAERIFALPYVPIGGAGTTGVAIADISGDGALDLASQGSNSSNYGEYSYGIGCHLGPPHDDAFAPGGGWGGEVEYGGWMTLGDLNGDGRTDVLSVELTIDEEWLLCVGLGRATGLALHSKLRIPDRPSSLAIGDLDGDGVSDVVVARWDSDSLTVYRGLGDGRLIPGYSFAQPRPAAIALADLDRDGSLDMVVSDTGGYLHALLGDGTGGFRRRWTGAIGVRTYRVQLADFNGDARLDLIIPGGVLLGDGAGSFGPLLSHGVEGAFAVGDLDANGRPDLAIVSRAGLFALLGRGDGTFAQTVVYNGNLAAYPWNDPGEVAVGDLDQDGHLDLAVAAGGIAIFYGNGDGTFGHDIPAYPVDNGARALVAGDMNGDGRADVAVLSQGASTVSLLLSTAGGTFLPKQNLDTGAVPEDLVLRDLDRDGNLDLAVAQPDPRRVSILSGHGDGTFGVPTVIPITTGTPHRLATGDLDEDGFLDLVVSSDTGVWAFFGGPSGAGASGRFANVIPSPGGGSLTVVDFTEDGHLDIAREAIDIDFVVGQGDGTFESPGQVSANHENDGGYAGPLVPMITNACSYGVLTTWYCCGCTHCPDALSLLQVLGPGCDEDGCHRGGVSLDGLGAASDQVGDVNGDGTDDLLTFGGSVLLGPRFDSRQTFTPYRSLDIAIGDLNGDAKLDLFLLRGSGSSDRRSVDVLLNQSARPTVPRAPGNLKAVSGGASIALSWSPVLHPDLAGYRVRYGIGPGQALAGTESSEGPSPIEVPAGQTSLTLHCLPDSTFSVKVTSVDGSGRESVCPEPVSARPGPAGGDFSFMGGTLNAASHGRWVMGLVRLDDGLSAAGIVPGSMMVNGVGPADPLGVTDRDHDGRGELMIRFPRSAVQGSGARVRVEGRVAGCGDTLRFAVDDSIRVRKPGARPLASTQDSQEGGRAVIAFALHPVAPSPASAGCAIAFDLPEPAAVKLSVFDLRGRLMSTVLHGHVPAGSHRVWWERHSLPDGLYFARIEAGRYRAVRTIVLIH